MVETTSFEYSVVDRRNTLDLISIHQDGLGEQFMLQTLEQPGWIREKHAAYKSMILLFNSFVRIVLLNYKVLKPQIMAPALLMIFGKGLGWHGNQAASWPRNKCFSFRVLFYSKVKVQINHCN